MTTPAPQQGTTGSLTVAPARLPQPLADLPPLPRPEFQTVPSGYHPSQVSSWIKKAGERIIALERIIESGAGHALHALATVEANPKARVLTEDLMRIAVDEVAGMRTQAAADIAQMMQDARQQAAATLDQAHAEATQTIAGAHEQANALLEDARTTAKQKMDDATAQAAAISEGAQRRMEAVVSLHAQATERLRTIATVASDAVAAEDERGSLTDEVQRILAPQPQEAPVQPSGPQPRMTPAAARRVTGSQPAAS